MRKAAVAEGADPDAAIVPLDDGPLGRAGHRVATAAGTLGRVVRPPGGRAARVLAGRLTRSSGAIVKPASLSCSQYSSAGSRGPLQTIACPLLWMRSAIA